MTEPRGDGCRPYWISLRAKEVGPNIVANEVGAKARMGGKAMEAKYQDQHQCSNTINSCKTDSVDKNVSNDR